ncbi:MAG: succinate-semialdehyde dehydrogenase/glutarate-semialdehyde dehydrogenase [Planctomycetaceae bacterium]|jgi:succinate-semialdehyde dehydrogenase/glutarate-semialdehyde dehydrogenase
MTTSTTTAPLQVHEPPCEDDVSPIRTVNPATGETISEFCPHDLMAVEQLIDQACTAAGLWKRNSLAERCDVVRGVAEHLKEQRDDLSRLATQEMGKPISQARAEIDKCIWLCEFYADRAADYLKPEDVDTDADQSIVRFDPLGVVLGIMPWNYPFWQVLRFAVPAMLAGNTVVLKHASNVTSCALAIERLFTGPGMLPDIFTTIVLSSDKVDMMISHPAIRAVSVTGSERAGREVASQAGRFLKKSVLELGGSDPFIVLDDADLDEAAIEGVKSRTQNNGESCIAAKRFIVIDRVYDEFVERFVAEMKSLAVGDPMNEDTDVGPIARSDLRDELHEQVKRSVQKGAKVLCGGKPVDGAGFYYEPTVLADVNPGMPAFDQEMFGPVAAVIRAPNEDEAIRLANESSLGLGASIWTSSTEHALGLAERIEAGAVFINAMVKSDPRVPIGGVKDSGYGRELGRYGIREFVNVKTVWVEASQ